MLTSRHALLPMALVAMTATTAQAQSIVYTDFSSTAGLQLNGAAAVANDGTRDVLRLTPPAFGQSGSMFSLSPRTLGSDYGFSTRFTFNINRGVNGGADGIVFVVQTLSNNVGGIGGGIGYSGITNSLGIEFDTWNNGSGDRNSDNHVGINLGGSIDSVALNTGLPFQLDGGTDITAWIDYNGTTKTLDVRYSADGIRPDAVGLSANVDLAAVLGSNRAFVGFTSGTGAASNAHDLVNWEFRDSFNPIGTGVPEPATWAMMIAGFGLVGGFARRRGATRVLA